ncbi:DNA repair exonuclease [Novosphingobium resinovorum]|uniref:metallophosphoesterase family protein n=1 Tax=Novosphingobium resinovorum TaxID=158500 RepID=UPI002ED0A466|nr:DNA repair exonuclease [Novosphingobium resinovorum]
MTSFRFLHAADIHLDSPLHGLSRYEGLPVDEIRSATRAAFDNLVQFAIDEAVDFVVIAGDLFDGDWRDMGTGLYFAKAMGRLDQTGIPAFLLAGNHDAASVISRTVPWPPNVHLFDSRRPETHRLAHLSVAVHGQSFSTPAVTQNLVLAYPPAEPHIFNIGMLHTALAGRQGHANYAPCSVEDLRSRGYDYWALGHVHEFEVVSNEPYVVFPGNVQGRTIREIGAKGAVLVDVADGEVAFVERVELDVIRWARLDVNCAGVGMDDAEGVLRSALVGLHGMNASGRPLIVRVTLVGETAAAGELRDRAATLRDDVRAIATSISPDLFVEKVRVEVTEPARTTVVVGEDLGAMIDGAAADPDLLAVIGRDFERFMLAASTSLDEPDDGELRLAATRGDWASVLATASTALRSRLTRDC